MMEKPVEELQAQIEAFAGSESFLDKKGTDRDQILLLAYADKLATSEEQSPDFTRLAELYKEQYVDFLRKKENRELVEQLKQSIARYNRFSTTANQLKDEIAQAGEPEKTRSFWGAGGTATTFKKVVNKMPYAFKLFGLYDEDEKSGIERVYDIYSDVRPMLYARGVEHVPQLVAHSLKDQVIVMSLMPGRPIAENTPGESERFTDEEIVQLIHIVNNLHEQGLAIDWFPENLLHDDEKGFSVLDYFYVGDDPHYSLEKQVMRLRHMLVGKRYREFFYRDVADYSAQSTAQSQERRRESLDLGLRILKIVKGHFPDIFQMYKEAELSEVLKLGDTSLFHEFKKDEPYDSSILDQAKTLLKS